jgi:hypothetical protein
MTAEIRIPDDWSGLAAELTAIRGGGAAVRHPAAGSGGGD